MIERNIVILGAGIVGIISALSLAKRGIKVTILEYKTINQLKDADDYRNLAITNFSYRWLKLNNLWDDLAPYAAPISNVYVVDNKDNDSILHLHKDDDAGSQIGHMIINRHLYASLLSQLIANRNIEFLDDSAYYDIISEDHFAIIKTKAQDIKANIVLVCDGRNSYARSKYCEYFVQKDYNQKALVFSVRHEKSHENHAIEHFLPGGVLAVLPTINQYESSLVWIQSSNVIDVLLTLEPQELHMHLVEVFGNFLGNIELNSAIASYPIKAELIKKYYHNKIVFMGDAAHVIHPLAGQGLNQGIKDVADFINMISQLNFLGINPNRVHFENYHQNRFRDNWAMFFLTDSLERLFVNDSPLKRRLRRFGLKAISSSRILRNVVTNYSMEQKLF